MPIVPLPIFEQEADPQTRGLTQEQAQSLMPPAIPESVVVRYGYMRQIAEFPFDLDFVPNCHTRLVIKSPRGTELADVLSRSCSSSSCGNVLTHDDIEAFIEQSGGRKYPFSNKGRVVRVATVADQTHMKDLEGNKRFLLSRAGEVADELDLDMKFIDVEPILGEERLTLYFKAHDRVDFRELVKELAREFKTRIEMRQVGARDEARLTADYERCGQHCCCRQFLKVLNRVPMRTAKVQKATLDPLKISGRCGRVMCCLLYEDTTYQELKRNLPHRKTRVGTADGPGIVIDTQIITQLVLVELEHDRSRIAVRVNELLDPESCPPPKGLGGYPARSSGASHWSEPSPDAPQPPEDDLTEIEPADADEGDEPRLSQQADPDNRDVDDSQPSDRDHKPGRRPLRRGRGSRGQSRSRRDRHSQDARATTDAGDQPTASQNAPSDGDGSRQLPHADMASAGEQTGSPGPDAGDATDATSSQQDGHHSERGGAPKSRRSGRKRTRGGRGGRKSRGKRQGKHKPHRGGSNSGGGDGGGGGGGGGGGSGSD